MRKRFIIITKKKLRIVLIGILLISLLVVSINSINISNKCVFGGNLSKETFYKETQDENVSKDGTAKVDNMEDIYMMERFFRPSSLPIINAREETSMLNENYNKKNSKINIPTKFLKTPEDTIINYFSLLREAANPAYNSQTGCGTIGVAKDPYPIAYEFLTPQYKKKMSYSQYLASFRNMLHINLIKLNKVPLEEDQKNGLRYFVEIEVIEGTNKPKGVFAYYFGYIKLENIDDGYRISDMDYTVENYLCAPYHGWAYEAKSFVEIEYGDWCKMIDGDVNIEQNGYQKRAQFKGKDGYDYLVLFYELTNGVDIKIGDYKKDENGQWKEIYINPEDCLNKK